MGKVNQRREQLLNYIQTKGQVSTKELLETFQIRKATLSEDITALKEQGIPLETPRGFVCLKQDINTGYYEKISASTIRHWFILLILSQSRLPMKFEALRQKYENLTYECSEDTLHKDLQQLQKQGYIVLNHNSYTYTLTSKYSSFISPTTEELDNFCYQYSQKKEANPLDLELARVHKIATVLNCGFEDVDSFDANDTYLVHGKRNLLSPELHHALQQILDLPFQKNKLSICYTTNKAEELTTAFSVGLIVYSVEKNKIYLLGETSEYRSIISIDSIKACSALEERNSIYNSELYQNIYKEMFSISVNDAVPVRVRFANKSFVHDKIRNLHANRPSSTMRLSEDNTEIIYTDTIRGIADFSNYLRQFGRSAIVDEPEELRQQMIHSAETIIANYRKEFHYE